MELIKSPNSWSCLPCSFAMACGITLDDFLNQVGNDGSEILWPDLGEPRQRKSFHIQECIRVCRNNFFTVTPMDFNPKATADGKRSYAMDQSNFVKDQMSQYKGVLTGMGRVHPHAVAWDRTKAYDPVGIIYDLPNPLFAPYTFWAVI